MKMDQRNVSPSWRRTALCPALVGREDDLRALVDTLDAAGASAGSVALIVGEAGIGKSRLAREVMHRARERGFAVLSGRAVESGSPTPFRPLTEALLTHLRRRR